MWSFAGTLEPVPAASRPDLVAAPVAEALGRLPDPVVVGVAAIDATLADTAAFCDAYGVAAEDSANCVVIRGKRGGDARFAACVVLATTRADVNGIVRKRLDVRSASFAPMDEAVALTGMEFGGITPFGLPDGWPVLIDAAVAASPGVVVGAGIRGAKLFFARRCDRVRARRGGRGGAGPVGLDTPASQATRPAGARVRRSSSRRRRRIEIRVGGWTGDRADRDPRGGRPRGIHAGPSAPW